MSNSGFNVFDLLDSPALEGDILIHLTCHGPADAAQLARATGGGLADVREALASLIRQARVRLAPDGKADLHFSPSP